MKFIIGDTPQQLAVCATADAMMIDGKVVTKADYLALSAQIQVLTAQLVTIDKIHSDLTNAEMVVEGCDHIGGLITNEQIDDIGNALSYPEDCLREIQAEAGRAGFIAGADSYFDRHYDKSVSDEVLLSADKYANRIRKGGE
jgi:hypothetical protein